MRNKSIVIFFVLLLVSTNLLTYYFAVGEDITGWRERILLFSSREEYKLQEEVQQEERELTFFYEVLEIIKNKHLEEIDFQKLEEGAVRGMLEALGDPQTTFFTAEDMENMLIHTKGRYEGIGVAIDSRDGFITIIAPIKGTPGEKVGLLPGDKIVEVDGKNIVGMDINEVVRMIRGPKGEPVTIKVQRESTQALLSYTIIRASIELESVFPKMLADNIGYIQITNFNNATGEDFEEALIQLEKESLAGLILDLRNNPGGLLSEAIRVSQAIVPAGPITHVVDGSGNVLKTYYSEQEKKPYPVVVLVNGFSASASEILAGALQDSHGALLVGIRTFGKATVQTLDTLSNNFGLRYTVARYLTPHGRSIHEEGLLPDYLLEKVENGDDNQLEKAIVLVLDAISE